LQNIVFFHGTSCSSASDFVQQNGCSIQYEAAPRDVVPSRQINHNYLQVAVTLLSISSAISDVKWVFYYVM